MLDSIAARMFVTAFLAFYLAAMFLYHFMVYRVNKHLAVGEKFPYSISFGERQQLRDLYRSLYPHSPIYQFTMTCAVMVLVLALALVGYRLWDFSRM